MSGVWSSFRSRWIQRFFVIVRANWGALPTPEVEMVCVSRARPRACHKREPRADGGRPTKLTCKPFHGCVTEGNERNVIRNIVCCTPQTAFRVKQKCSARGRTSERLGANPGEAVARSNCRGKSAGRLQRPISMDSRNRAMAPRFFEMEYPFDEVTSVSR